MEYLTFEETTQKWDISAKRVTMLCKDGRIWNNSKRWSFELATHCVANWKGYNG